MRSKLFSSIVPGRAQQQAARPVGRVWPNGEFSLGYVPVLEDADHIRGGYLQGAAPPLDKYVGDDVLEQLELWADTTAGGDSVHGQPCTESLTLSEALNSHEPPPRAAYGLKGLTVNGRKMIRSGCYLLEQRLGRGDCVMVTLTVPELDIDSRVAVAKGWGILTNRLVQYLTRELVSQGRKPTIIGCVEIQSGRLAKYSQGYLHLHLIAPAHSNMGRTWAIDSGDLLAWWASALERIVGHSLPHRPRIETAIVEKSVEAYLAKYLSKGSSEELDAFIADLGEECVPGQWWFCSAPMRHAIIDNTMSGASCGVLLEAMVEYLLEQGDGEGFEYIRHVDRKVGGSLVTCGWVGRMSQELRAELDSMLRPS